MAKTSDNGIWKRYVGGIGKVDGFVSKNLGACGAVVACNPIRTVLVAVVLSIGLSSGIIFIADRTEDDVGKLWVPQGSTSKINQEFMGDWLGESDTSVDIMFEAKGNNVLTVEATNEMFEVLDMLLGVTVQNDGKDETLKDVCFKNAAGECRERGYLSIWRSQEAVYTDTVSTQQQALLDSVNTKTDGFGSPVVRASTFGLPVFEGDRIVGAKIVQQYYRTSSASVDWTDAVEDLFYPDDKPLDTFQHINVYLVHPESVANAIGSSVGQDINLVVIAFIVISIVAVLVLTQLDRVYTRPVLAMLGVVSVFLSIGASFGLCIYIGINFTSVTSLLPFILLGIGVDDMFVLVRSMEEIDLTHAALSESDRFRKCMESGGVSITVTTLTNMAAFAFGSITGIPAIKWFCWYACIAVAFDWVLQVTFFLACFVLTERRISASRLELCCCIKRSPEDTIKAQNAGYRTVMPFAPTGSRIEAEKKAHADALDPPTSPAGITPMQRDANKPVVGVKSAIAVTLKKGVLTSDKESLLYVLIVRYLLPMLLHPVTMVLVLAVFLGGAVAGGIGVTRLGEGLPISDLAPDNHYAKTFYDKYDSVFKTTAGINGQMVFRGIDHSSPATQRLILDSFSDLLADFKYFDEDLSPRTNWLTALHDWTVTSDPAAANDDGTVVQEGFFPRLNLFLEAEPKWINDLVAADKSRFPLSDIQVSSIGYVHIGREEGNEGYDRLGLQNVRKAESELNDKYFDGEDTIFLFAPFYTFWETDAIIFKEMATNLGFAILGIVVISLVMLVHPVAVLLVVAGIVVVDLLLLAEMWVLDISLNTISVVNLVMAVGLSVDYSVHIVHKFLTIRGPNRKARIIQSMGEVGSAIIVGVISTLSGVLALGASSSTIFRTFFQLLLGTVIFGGIVGMLLIPVLLRLVGPDPCLCHTLEEGPMPKVQESVEDNDTPTERQP